jgi:vacuolar-type H+-ATPase subunit H
MAEPDLVQQARAEADAIVAEAQEQARRLLEAAEERRKVLDDQVEKLRSEGRELALNLERSIQLLTQIFEELRRQTG